MMTLPTDESTSNEGRSHAERLHALFAGGPWHGTYRHEPTPVTPGKKVEIKKSAKTYQEPATPELWQRHLDGAAPLGICPLREGDTCLFAAIDDDDRMADHAALVGRVREAGLPLVVCRSKSGGAHFYLFLSEPMPAADVRQKMSEIAAALGYPPRTEIFPRQTCMADIDSAGSWINMPYFQGEETNRHAFKDGGLGMTLAEFLDLAERSRLSPDDFMALRASSPARPEGRDAGRGTAPSADEFDKLLTGWLRRLADAPHGTRDDTLMRTARDIGRWASVISLDYQATQQRVQDVWQKLGKPDHEFHAQYHHNLSAGQKQGDPPRLADGGSGGDGDLPTIEKLVVLTGGAVPEWRLMLKGRGEITLPVKEVVHFYTFNLRCSEKLHRRFQQMKAAHWDEMIDAALQRAEYETVEEDEKATTIMMEQLRGFLWDKHAGVNDEGKIDEIVLHKPVHVPSENRIYFAMEDFEAYLRKGSSRFKNETRENLGRLIGAVVGKGNYKRTTKSVKANPAANVRYIVRSALPQVLTSSVPLPSIEPPPV